MPAQIAFTDATGAATLSNGLEAPFDRFGAWTPDVVEIGKKRAGAGSGVSSLYRFRTDFVVSLRVEYLPASMLAIAHRLKQHLISGGTCTVDTGDIAAHSYTCMIQPGTVPTIELADRQYFEYALTLQLRNQAAAPLICEY